MSHLYKIVSQGKTVTFKKNRAQQDFDKNRHSFNVILKSRQLGFTTFEAIDNLDDILFHKNFYARFVAHTKDDAKRIFDDKVKFAWENIPELLRKEWSLDTDKADALRVGFSDNTFSSLIVTNSGRGGTNSRVHVSEYGKLCKLYPEKADEIITGTIPSVPSGGRFDIESTAEGETGHFYDMFWEAWDRGEPEFPKQFKAHFYNWMWDDLEIGKTTPEEVASFLKSKDYADFDNYRKEMSERGINISDLQLAYYYKAFLSQQRNWSKLKQEYPTTPEEAFQGSGNKMFDQAVVERIETIDGKRDGDWTVFKEFLPAHRYVMGADIAEGVGQDSSTAVILDITHVPYEVVATFQNNRIDPVPFATELARYGARYGNCIIAPEMNSVGYATVNYLKDMYKNVYRDTDYKRDFETKSKYSNGVKTLKYGWRTTGATKPNMMYDIKEAINNEEIIINSKLLKTEIRTYDQEDLSKIRFDEKQSKHWDLLMALAIAYQMRTKVSSGRAHSYSIGVETF